MFVGKKRGVMIIFVAGWNCADPDRVLPMSTPLYPHVRDYYHGKKELS